MLSRKIFMTICGLSISSFLLLATVPTNASDREDKLEPDKRHSLPKAKKSLAKFISQLISPQKKHTQKPVLMHKGKKRKLKEEEDSHSTTSTLRSDSLRAMIESLEEKPHPNSPARFDLSEDMKLTADSSASEDEDRE